MRNLFLIISLLALGGGQALAAWAPDFDRGVDVRAAIRAALEEASSAGGLLPVPPARPENAGAVWISMQKADVAALDDALFKRAPAAENARIAVYDFSEDELELVADGMHRAARKAPGFFAYGTLEEALEDLKAPPAAPSRDYVLDQAGQVMKAVDLVREEPIVAMIKALSAYRNRGYRSVTGIDASKWLQREWARYAEGRDFVSVEPYKHAAFPQESVVLTMKGASEPDKVIIIGGHLDSVAGYGDNPAPGADDNASGVAVTHEAIRALLESGYRPAKTIKFIAFAAEEAGLRGSGDIAAAFQKAGVRVEGMLNLDMVNYKGSEKDIYFVTDNSSAGQNEFLGRLVDAYLGYQRGTLKCGYGCSDHASWTKKGYPASYAFESTFEQHSPFIHKETDTLANCGGGAAHALKFARLAAAYAVELAK